MHQAKKVWRGATGIAVLPLLATLSACGSGPPRATEGKWTLASSRPGKSYVFDASFRFSGGQGGWFKSNLLLADERGCPVFEELETIFPVTKQNPDSFRATLHKELGAKGPFSRAKLTLVYRPDGAPPGDPSSERTVFEEERVLDATVKPADQKACADKQQVETVAARKARLREKAKTDPDGADAEAIDNMGRNELMATAINSAGYLCARVTDMHPSGTSIVVSCVEYRSGRGRVRYRVDPSAGSVEQM